LVLTDTAICTLLASTRQYPSRWAWDSFSECQITKLGRGTLENVIKATKPKIKRRFHRILAIIAHNA
jgi:hypothetical protein